MMSKVPEMKLVKPYRFNRKKYTDEAALCFIDFYCLFLKSNFATTLPLHLDYLVLPKRRRNKLMNFSCSINFIFHQLVITYNSITITLI